MTLYRITDEAKKPFWHGIIDDLLIDEVLVPVEREIYVTTCDNHSGGPASPHVLGCFKELAGIGETPRGRCPENIWNGDMGPCVCKGKVHPGAGIGETP